MPPRRAHPISNTALAAAIEAAGWTRAQTARHVNAVAAENGVPLHYDHSTVGHWLTGTTPRAEGIAACVEAFRRILHRPDLTAATLGWPEVAAAPRAADDPWQGNVVAHLTTLGEDDMLTRRSAMRAGLYSVTAAALPASLPPLPPPARGRRIALWQVNRIEDVTRHLSTLDDRYGGGTRTPVVAYLVHDVLPLVQEATGPHRPALLAAASRLAYLAGWMAYDSAEHPVSQRYYVQGVRLAAEAGDDVQRAGILRALALQAVELGHAQQGRDLADAATDALRAGGPPRTRAWVAGVRAQAYAAADDSRTALTLLAQVERDAERADSAPGWTGSFAPAALAHQTGQILTELGDLPTAERYLAASVAARPGSERRSRALVALRLADVQTRQRRFEEAAATVLQLRDDLPEVTSARVSRYTAGLRRAWQTQRSIPAVAEADKVIVNSQA